MALNVERRKEGRRGKITLTEDLHLPCTQPDQRDVLRTRLDHLLADGALRQERGLPEWGELINAPEVPEHQIEHVSQHFSYSTTSLPPLMFPGGSGTPPSQTEHRQVGSANDVGLEHRLDQGKGGMKAVEVAYHHHTLHSHRHCLNTLCLLGGETQGLLTEDVLAGLEGGFGIAGVGRGRSAN